MSSFITLPTPLSSTPIALGQLIAGPFLPGSQQQPQHDASTTYLPPTCPRSLSARTQPNSKTHLTSLELASPKTTFNALRHDPAAQSFLRTSAHQQQQLYYVTGVQTLTSQSSAKDSTTPAQADRTHVRRVDSASSLDDKANETVCAVQLCKVRARVGRRCEPHSVDDVEFEWSYHALDEDVQLAIGLGRALRADDVRTVDLDGGEEESEESWEDSGDEDGLGGF